MRHLPQEAMPHCTQLMAAAGGMMAPFFARLLGVVDDLRPPALRFPPRFEGVVE